MEGVAYFFDTYALVELVKKNQRYEPFVNSVIVTTQFNLAELYWSVLRDYGEQKAENVEGEGSSLLSLTPNSSPCTFPKA